MQIGIAVRYESYASAALFHAASIHSASDASFSFPYAARYAKKYRLYMSS